MCYPHGRNNLCDQSLRDDDFQSPFVYILAAALLPDGRVGGIGRKERPLPRKAKAAFGVLANDTGAGREEHIRHLSEVGIRNEYHELALACRVARPKRELDSPRRGGDR